MKESSPTELPSPKPVPDRQLFVVLALDGDDGWPPYPFEVVTATPIGCDRALLTSTPRFAIGLSQGDIVAVEYDQGRALARGLISRGGHSSVQVVTAHATELDRIAHKLARLGNLVVYRDGPPMLSVDVPADRPLEPVLRLLASRVSMTCAYVVSCRQHEDTATAPPKQ